MKNDGFEPYSAAVGLSRQKNSIELTRTFIHTLRELQTGLDACILEVFRLQPIPGEGRQQAPLDVVVRRFDETGFRVDKDPHLPELETTIQDMRASCVELDGELSRLFIPVSHDAGPGRIVVVDRVPADPWLRTKILQIIEIYGNLVQLMDGRERDVLTGLLNRQTFAILLQMSRRRMIGGVQVHTLLAMLDIDHFKRVNDTYGHLYGDEVLIHFARLMERSFRYTDDLFRFGGEEFVVLLSTEDLLGGVRALERFRLTVAQHNFPGVGHITVSIGYVVCDDTVLPTSLIDRADKALYFAKQNGRDRVVNYGDIEDHVTDEGGTIDLF